MLMSGIQKMQMEEENLAKMTQPQLVQLVKALLKKRRVSNIHRMNKKWNDWLNKGNISKNLKNMNTFLDPSKSSKRSLIANTSKQIKKQRQCLVKAFGFTSDEIQILEQRNHFDILFLYNQQSSMSSLIQSQQQVFHELIQMMQSCPNVILLSNENVIFKDNIKYFFPSCSNNKESNQNLFQITVWDNVYYREKKNRDVLDQFLYNYYPVFYVNNDQRRSLMYHQLQDFLKFDKSNKKCLERLTNKFNDDNDYQFWVENQTGKQIEYTKLMIQNQFEVDNNQESQEQSTEFNFWYNQKTTKNPFPSICGNLKILKDQCSDSSLKNIMENLKNDYYITDEMSKLVLKCSYCKNEASFDLCIITVLMFLQDQLVFQTPDDRQKLHNLAMEHNIYHFNFNFLKNVIHLFDEISFENIKFIKQNNIENLLKESS